MVRPLWRWLAPSLLMFAAAGAAADSLNAQLEDVIQSARVYIPANIIERAAPRYPASELNRGNEAWVHLTYCIDESGRTRNVTVVDSTGRRRFDKAAVETVEGWLFEPALLNGNPSWQSRNQTYISFAIEQDDRGATRRFVRAFKKLGKHMDEENLEAADALFQDVLEHYDLSLYELSKLWAQRVRYEAMKGDMFALDKALHRATASGGQWIEPQSYTSLLKLRVKVEIEIGQYTAAIETFDALVKHAGEDAEEVKSLEPVMQRLGTVVEADEPLRIQAQVRSRNNCTDCDGSWSFTPVRDSFALHNISGNLSRLDMRCDHKRFESIVSDQVDWNIPASWGSCHVYVYGEAATTFDVVMMSSAN